MSNGHGIVHGAVVALALCFAPISVHAQRDPSSRCAALAPEDQSPLTPPPTRRPRELLVFAASWVAAPLDASEHAAVVDAVRQSMARTTGLAPIAAEQTDALVREARLGRALGREVCAAPLTLSDALEDARPDALIAEVHLACEDAVCAVNVEVIGANVVEPANASRLHAIVTGAPQSVRAWHDAVATLALPTQSTRLSLVAFSAAGSSVRRADVYGEGLSEDTLRMALERMLPELSACAPALRLSFATVLDVAVDGVVRVVHRTEGEVEGAACREAALARIRVDAATSPRRAIVGVALNEPGQPSDVTVDVPGRVRFGAFAISDPRLEADDGMEAITRAIARCDAAGQAPFDAAIRLTVGGTGRITRVTVSTDAAAQRRCLERELLLMTTTCPRERRPAEMRYAVCVLAR